MPVVYHSKFEYKLIKLKVKGSPYSYKVGIRTVSFMLRFMTTENSIFAICLPRKSLENYIHLLEPLLMASILQKMLY